MSRRSVVSLLSVVVVLSSGGGALIAQSPEPAVPVTGRTLRVTLASGEELWGELIEVSDGGLVIAGELGTTSVAQADVSRIRWQRHRFGSRRMTAWILIGGLASGAGMTVACAQVQDGCAAVFPAVALSWGLVAGIMGAAVSQSAWADLPVSDDELRPYARFPQGAPASFRPGGGPGR